MIKEKITWFRQRPVLVAIFCNLLLFVILTLVADRRPGTDDIVFQSQTLPYHSLGEWITWRYQSWTGRIVPESLTYLLCHQSIWLWRILQIGLFAAMLFAIRSYARLFKLRPYLTVLLLSFFWLIPYHILSDAVFWMTGSLNYFWPAVFAIVGLYPIIFLASKKTLPKKSAFLATSPFLLLAVFSQEQLALIIPVTIAVAAFALRKEKIPSVILPLLLSFFISAAGSFVVLLAPGNKARAVAEADRWTPGFYSAGIPEHTLSWLHWFSDMFFNRTGLLIAILAFVLATILIQRKSKIDRLSGISCLGISLLLGLKGHDPISRLFATPPQWHSISFGIGTSLLLILTPLVIALLLFSIFRASPRRYPLVGVVSFFLAVSCVAAVGLSPTRYASGLRPLFIPSLLMAISIFYALHNLKSFHLQTKIQKTTHTNQKMI